jgi:aminoglycoside phosphotransferase (APT) family kinase protein
MAGGVAFFSKMGARPVFRYREDQYGFTHSALRRKNVIVQPDGTLVLINWELSWWGPLCREFELATFENDDDWSHYVRIILETSEEASDKDSWFEYIRGWRHKFSM